MNDFQDQRFGPGATGTIEMRWITEEGAKELEALDGSIRPRVMREVQEPIQRMRCTPVDDLAYAGVMHFYLGGSIRVMFRMDQDGATVLGAAFHDRFNHVADHGTNVKSNRRVLIKVRFMNAKKQKPISNSNSNAETPVAAADAARQPECDRSSVELAGTWLGLLQHEIFRRIDERLAAAAKESLARCEQAAEVALSASDEAAKRFESLLVTFVAQTKNLESAMTERLSRLAAGLDEVRLAFGKDRVHTSRRLEAVESTSRGRQESAEAVLLSLRQRLDQIESAQLDWNRDWQTLETDVHTWMDDLDVKARSAAVRIDDFERRRTFPSWLEVRRKLQGMVTLLVQRAAAIRSSFLRKVRPDSSAVNKSSSSVVSK